VVGGEVLPTEGHLAGAEEGGFQAAAASMGRTRRVCTGGKIKSKWK
jgi:hypothetical protein